MARRTPITPPNGGSNEELPPPVLQNETVQSEADDEDMGTAFDGPAPSPAAAPRVIRPPNPDIMKGDPMAEMFGPGSNVKMLGDPETDEMPDEIRSLIEDNGLGKRDFQCVLKEIPQGTNGDGQLNSTNSVYIKGWKRTIPSLDYIAREHGPGSYVLILTWRYLDREENINKAKREEVPIFISDKCAAEHKKALLDRKIKDAARTGEKVREAIMDNTIEGKLISAITGKDDTEKKQSPKEYLEEIMNTVRALGLPVGGFGAVAPPKIEWDKILAIAIPAVTAVAGIMQQASQRRSEENNKMIMLMLSQSQSSSSQVIEMYKAMAQKPAADNPLKELQQLVMSAMDIKEMMNPAKETLSDKIFRVVEMVAPQILTIAANAAATKQPPSGPMVNMAKQYVKSDPDFAALHNNPAELVKFVNRLDDRLGWENADIILGTVEWERPPQCPRDPNKRFAPQQQAVDAVVDDGGVAPQDE